MMYSWLGHVLSHKNFLHDIIEGKMATRGWKRMKLLHDWCNGRQRYGQL